MTTPGRTCPNDAPQDLSAGAGGPSLLLQTFLLAGVCGVLFLSNSAALPLSDPEESRCALIVRQMLAGGDWIVPHLEGEPYFDKPAPFFWLAAAGQVLTGSAELGGRLIPALAAMCAVFVAFCFARRLWGDPAGVLAGVILATSGEFLFLARWYRMDMPFAAAMWAAVWWFWKYDSRRLEGLPVPGRRMWVGFYALAGVATLFKGPAGLGLPVIIVGGYLLLSRQGKRLLELLNPWGLGVYLLIAAPWYLAVALREPGYAYEFFVRQNLLRYVGGARLGHHWPGILYVPILLAGMLPWTVYLPGTVGRLFPWRWRLRAERPAVLLLWPAVLLPLLFFCFSGTKLAGYILPVFPPLAVLVAGLIAPWIRSHQDDALMKHGARAMLGTIVILPLVPIGVEIYLGAAGAWLAVPACIALVSAAAMVRSLRLARRGAFVSWAAVAIVGVYLYLIWHTAPIAYGLMSTRHLARSIPQPLAPNAEICFWDKAESSLLLYAGIGQGERFRQSDPAALGRLMERLAGDHVVYCLVSGQDLLGKLQSACPVPLHVVAQQQDLWLVANRPPHQGAETQPASGPAAAGP